MKGTPGIDSTYINTVSSKMPSQSTENAAAAVTIPNGNNARDLHNKMETLKQEGDGSVDLRRKGLGKWILDSTRL